MTKLEKLKEAFKDQECPLSYLAYHSWCTLELGKSFRPTVEQLDDVYCGLVSGVLYNLGSGKSPKVMEGIGPDDKDRFGAEAYQKLWFALVGMGRMVYDPEKWLEEHPESEDWAVWIEESIILENSYIKDPETWLINFRKKLIQDKINEHNIRMSN